MTHIYVSKIIIIGSDNGLAPGRRQVITGTNAGIFLIGPLGIISSEILIECWVVVAVATQASRESQIGVFTPASRLNGVWGS